MNQSISSRHEIIQSYHDELVSIRNDFHMHPELGFEEVRTSGRVMELLKEWGVEYITGFAKTAVIAVLHGTQPGPVIGVRADMDALPLQDTKTVPYHSQVSGVCHACGHDAHTTVGLGLAKYYSAHPEDLRGTLKIVFQPAEEGPSPGGGLLVTESGMVDDIDIMLGIHTDPDYPIGKLVLCRGEMFASHDTINIEITGRGGHGAYPHLAHDPLNVAVQAYTAFQTIITKDVEPAQRALLNIVRMHCGQGNHSNVIEQSAVMGGSMRTFDKGVRQLIIDRMDCILKHLCEMNSCTYKLDVGPLGEPIINDSDVVDAMEKAGQRVVGEDMIYFMPRPELGTDDFSYYRRRVPKNAYFYLGSMPLADMGKFTFHESNYDVDPAFYCIGTELLVEMIDELSK